MTDSDRLFHETRNVFCVETFLNHITSRGFSAVATNFLLYMEAESDRLRLVPTATD